ncbi:MAG: sugar phosphate nucleotidyltransferase [Pseudomonadota bacterium]
MENTLQNLAIIILAAGKGTRMKSTEPKVLHGFAGRPMLGHILAATQALNPARTVVITGFGAEAVESYCSTNFKNIEFARQTEQKGTGHAVQLCAEVLGKHSGPIVILYGDVMLNMRPDVLPALLAAHAKNANGLTLLGATVENPQGLGRMFMEGNKARIVEDKDCTPEQRKCQTANPGIYAVHGPLLWPLVAGLKPNNAQAELYLTDIVEAAHAHAPVALIEVPAERAEMGINSRTELAAMDALWQARKRESLMAQGVTLIGPETCFFSHDTHIGADSTIGPHVVCGVGVSLPNNSIIEPFTKL